MIDPNALERQLADESLRIVGPEPVVDDAAIYAAVTSGTSHSWRLPSVFGTARFVAAGLVVALAGSVMLNDLLPRSSGRQVTPAPAGATSPADTGGATITFPTELPPRASRGTFETDVGPVEWIRLSGKTLPGPEGTLPRAAQLVPWDDGIATWFRWGAQTELASTMDGVDWQVEELPAEPHVAGMHWSGYGHPGLGVIDGTAYLVLSESGQVWSREAGGEWSRLDSSAIEGAMLGEGWARRSRAASDPRSVGGNVYFEITDSYALPREELGIRPTEWTEWLTPLDDGRFDLCTRQCTGTDQRRKRTFRVDTTAAGLRVADDRTGETLGVIAGATPSDLYDGDEGRHTAAFIIDGSTVVRVDPLADGVPDTGVAGAEPPADTAPEFENEWLRREASDRKWTSRWVSIGDEWVSLRGVVPRSQRSLWGARTGNVIALTSDYYADSIDLWLLVLPEGE